MYTELHRPQWFKNAIAVYYDDSKMINENSTPKNVQPAPSLTPSLLLLRRTNSSLLHIVMPEGIWSSVLVNLSTMHSFNRNENYSIFKRFNQYHSLKLLGRRVRYFSTEPPKPGLQQRWNYSGFPKPSLFRGYEGWTTLITRGSLKTQWDLHIDGLVQDSSSLYQAFHITNDINGWFVHKRFWIVLC